MTLQSTRPIILTDTKKQYSYPRLFTPLLELNYWDIHSNWWYTPKSPALDQSITDYLTRTYI